MSDEREKIQIEEPERVADRVAEEEDEDFEAHRLQVERMDNDGKVDVGRVDAGRVDDDGRSTSAGSTRAEPSFRSTGSPAGGRLRLAVRAARSIYREQESAKADSCRSILFRERESAERIPAARIPACGGADP